MVELFGLLGFLGGVVAGAAGSFGGKFLWRYYSRPHLQFDSEARYVGVHEDRGDVIEMVASIYRISVTNTGKTADTNCRPRIHLKSTDVPSPAEKYWEPPDPDDLPPDVDPDQVVEPKLEGMTFEIDTAVTWSEGTETNRITVNAGETVEFDLLMVDQRKRNTGEDRIFKIKFPSEQGWDRPAQFYVQHDQFSALPMDPSGITRHQVVNAEWDVSQVEVTSENAEKVAGELAFDDEKGWVQVSVR